MIRLRPTRVAPVVRAALVLFVVAAAAASALVSSSADLTVTNQPASEGRPITPAGSLVHFVETLDAAAGVCLDFAHAQRGGDLVDTIETVSEHLITTHVPVDSAIDWLSALTAVQKVGYEGPFVFDIVGRVAAKETLQRARKVRERMERMLVTE